MEKKKKQTTEDYDKDLSHGPVEQFPNFAL